MAVGNYVSDMGRQHSFAIPNGVLHPQANAFKCPHAFIVTRLFE
jgi:hypothetical protein